jgi:hypothetical protein
MCGIRAQIMWGGKKLKFAGAQAGIYPL